MLVMYQWGSIAITPVFIVSHLYIAVCMSRIGYVGILFGGLIFVGLLVPDSSNLIFFASAGECFVALCTSMLTPLYLGTLRLCI